MTFVFLSYKSENNETPKKVIVNSDNSSYTFKYFLYKNRRNILRFWRSYKRCTKRFYNERFTKQSRLSRKQNRTK